MATPLYMFRIDVTPNNKVVAKSKKKFIKLIRNYSVFGRTVGISNCDGSVV